jgi:hypothetical protein
MIIDVLFAACAAFYLIEVIEWQKYIYLLTGYGERPFNCVCCLSAWLGLFVGVVKGYGHESIYVMVFAGVLGCLLSRLIIKL